VVIEGMTMGKVVVACDVGDVSYIIDDGDNGVVVPPKDLEALTGAMLQCAGLRREEFKAIGDRAHKKALAQFSQAVHVEKMRGIFIGAWES
jgi:glycosyltransferase involved in cell wall biosynthesis